jgi:hypothetical protein
LSRDAMRPSISATLCSIIKEISSSLLEIKPEARGECKQGDLRAR